MCEAVGAERAEAYKLALFESWHGAAFQRTKRLPDLRNMLQSHAEPVDDDGAEAALRRIAMVFGGDIREASDGGSDDRHG